MNGYLEYLAKTVPVISTRQTVINISQMGNIMGDMIYLENGYKTGGGSRVVQKIIWVFLTDMQMIEKIIYHQLSSSHVTV